MLRYDLLHDSISLGLLSSGFSFVGLNFLWSSDFLGALATKKWNKNWYRLGLLITCTLVATVAGPSSALLFIPADVWERGGSVKFYMGGAASQLWPMHITANHTGPDICNEVPLRMNIICAFGAFRALSGLTFRGVLAGNTDVMIADRHVRRVLKAYTYIYGTERKPQSVPETWAYTSRGDIAFFLGDLQNAYIISQDYATGRNKKLQAFNAGNYYISEGKIPVCRTVCGPAILPQNDTTSLPFPVLAPKAEWRNISFGPDQAWGLLKNATVTSLSRADTTVVAPTSAQWIELDSSFGATSAGLAVITQNQTMTVARGCSIDCRWSVGQTFQRESRMLGIFEAHIGEAMKPDGNMYAPPEIASFFDEQNSRWYSDTIRADQAWLDTISPINTNTDVTGDKGVTLFEHLLKNGGLYFPITDKDPIGSFGYITVVEYAKPSPKVFQ